MSNARLDGGDFWAGRRILITGHTGFKGGWLALWLQSRGAVVTGYSLAPPTHPSLFDLANVGAGMTSVEGDIRDLAHLQAVFREHEPEIVFHLAAQSLVLESYQDPVSTYTTNVTGTAHVLEAARHTPGVRVVIAITSDKCYENREWVWGYRENDPMGGHDPYSSSKGCAELVIAAYARSFFGQEDGKHPLALASARAGNVIGGGDYATNRLIPDLVRGFEHDQVVPIRRPGAIRPWQHVLEPLAGYLRLAEYLWRDRSYSGGWNFGPRVEDAVPVLAVVEHAARRWGPSARWQAATEAQPHEAASLRLDCTKATTLLGWTPRLTLDTALDWTIEWFRAKADGADMRELSLAQIARYEDVR